MLLLGWVSWDNFVVWLKKARSGICRCWIFALWANGVLTLLSVTLDQFRNDCSSPEDLRVNFPMQELSQFGTQYVQVSWPKSNMDYDWNINTTSSGARLVLDQLIFEWRRLWEGCCAVQVADPNKGLSLAVQNLDRAKLGLCRTKGIVGPACF